MSSSSGPSPARPRQVTIAGVMAAVACVLLVLGLFDTMSGIRSTETQDSVEEFLSSAPGDRLGLDVDGVVDVLRGVVLLSGALAAAGAILAVYCLRRHRGARIGLSVVAVAMLFSTTFVAGLLPFVVALSASMLWRREARDWFDGRAPQPQQRATVAASPSTGQLSGQSTGWPPPAHDPWPAPTPASGASRAHRPPTVTAAVWITWVSTAFVLLLVATLVIYLLVDRSALTTLLRQNPNVARLGYTTDQLTGALWVLAVVVTFWAIAAAAFATLAFFRVRAGQVGVVVCAVLGGVVGAGTVVAPVVALVTVVLLVLRDANRWFARRDELPAGSQGRPPQPPTQPPTQPPPRPPDLPSGKPPVW